VDVSQIFATNYDFQNYNKYIFDDLVRKATEEVTVFSGKLDATEKESYD
jgi:hypothetical protein